MRLTKGELKTIKQEVDTLSDQLDCFGAVVRLEELQLKLQKSFDLAIEAESKDLPYNVIHMFKRK